MVRVRCMRLLGDFAVTESPYDPCESEAKHPTNNGYPKYSDRQPLEVRLQRELLR